MSEFDAMEAYLEDLRVQLARVKVGAASMICCQEDLHVIKTEQDAGRIRAEFEREIASPKIGRALVPEVFDSLLDGLRHCRAMYRDPIAPIERSTVDELDQRIRDEESK